MELFTIKLSQNTDLYHGSNNNKLKLPLQNKPTWFCENTQHISKYGQFIYSFKNNVELKLIDICSPIFQMHYSNEINNKFTNSDDRMKYLVALGLPNYNTQDKFIGQPKCSYKNKKEFDTVNYYLNFTDHLNRFSQKKSDGDFVMMLKNIYPSFDGYISKQLAPSLYQCGFLIPEVCIFDITKLFFQNMKTNNQVGGNKKRNNKKNKKKIFDDPAKCENLWRTCIKEEYDFPYNK
jgi:hypothetical protein